MPRKRNKSFKIRFDDKEFEQINIQVNKSGLSREAYTRSILLDAKVPEPIPPDTFNTVISQLRRIGNNINQLAVIANKTGNIDWNKYKNYYEELNKEILEIRRIVCNGESGKDGDN